MGVEITTAYPADRYEEGQDITIFLTENVTHVLQNYNSALLLCLFYIL